MLLEQSHYLQHISSYRPVTECQYPAIFEIMDTKHIGVTTLTIQGHVTSSSLGSNGAPIGNGYLGITWPWKVKVVTPRHLEANISKNGWR